MKQIDILSPVYNEKDCLPVFYERVKAVRKLLNNYNVYHVFIDNRSNDGTYEMLKEIADKDPKVRVIRNSKNFGVVKSCHHGILQCFGDAVVPFFVDLQEPPELILEFVKKWELGFPIVKAVKTSSEERFLLRVMKNYYYRLLKSLADVELSLNYNGIGLYDRKIVDLLRSLPDRSPFLRGMIGEIGFEQAEVFYEHKERFKGFSKNTFYSLVDQAISGIVAHSRVPLRLATFVGLFGAGVSLLSGFGYLIFKLIYWDGFILGMAPLIFGVTFTGSIQLIFLGLLGEYVGAIHLQSLARPLVIEDERINF